MWITWFMIIAISQSIVQGYEYLGDNEEDMFNDLESWRNDANKDRSQSFRFDTSPVKTTPKPPVPNSEIAAAHHSLLASKAAKVARSMANLAKNYYLLAVAQALKAAYHAKQAAHAAYEQAKKATGSSQNSTAVIAAAKAAAAAVKSSGGSASAAAAAAKAAAANAAKGGAAAKAVAAAKAAAAAAAAAAGKKPGSSGAAGAKKGSKPGSSSGAAAGIKPTSGRPIPTGTSGSSSGSSPGSSSSALAKECAAGQVSSIIEIRFATMKFDARFAKPSDAFTVKAKAIMCNKVKAVYQGQGICKCEVMAFRPGSVLVLFKLHFSKKYSNQNCILPLTKLKGALAKGFTVGKFTADKKPTSEYCESVNPACKPCNKKLAPGVKMIKQGSCPTGYCAMLRINPSQILQAASAAQAPAQPAFNQYQQPAQTYSYQQQPSQALYGATSCSPACQPSPPTYACNPSCPAVCCRRG